MLILYTFLILLFFLLTEDKVTHILSLDPTAEAVRVWDNANGCRGLRLDHLGCSVSMARMIDPIDTIVVGNKLCEVTIKKIVPGDNICKHPTSLTAVDLTIEEEKEELNKEEFS